MVKNILHEKGYDFWFVNSESTVYEALLIMSEKDIGAVLVIDNGKLSGIFSERDYARKLILKGHFSKDSKVKDYMTKELITVTPQTSIIDCMSLMTENHIRHLPVMDNENLMGIITIGDIVNEVIHSQKLMIKDLENYITGRGYGH